VLSHCIFDNGRGFARQKLLKHQHEKESGNVIFEVFLYAPIS
jgi:hypothetical protein